MTPEKYFLEQINPYINELALRATNQNRAIAETGESIVRSMLATVLIKPSAAQVRHDYGSKYEVKISDTIKIQFDLVPTPKEISSLAKEVDNCRNLGWILKSKHRSTAGAKRFGAWFRARNGKKYDNPKLLQEELDAYFDFLGGT